MLKEKVAGAVVVTKTGFGHYHTGAAIDEFGVGQLHVNHSVATDVTETYHRGCGNHVKNQLCGSAGLHAGDLVIGLIAGGDGAIRKAVEGAEDDPEQGWKDIEAFSPTRQDTVVGIAASGTTPCRPSCGCFR